MSLPHYAEFIREWVGLGFIFPLLYVFLLFGPFALLFLGASTRRESFKKLGIFVAACTFFAYFFLCLGTGIYLGKYGGLGAWGIPLGFGLFAGTILAYVLCERVIRRAVLHARR